MSEFGGEEGDMKEGRTKLEKKISGTFLGFPL